MLNSKEPGLKAAFVMSSSHESIAIFPHDRCGSPHERLMRLITIKVFSGELLGPEGEAWIEHALEVVESEVSREFALAPYPIGT